MSVREQKNWVVSVRLAESLRVLVKQYKINVSDTCREALVAEILRVQEMQSKVNTLKKRHSLKK